MKPVLKSCVPHVVLALAFVAIASPFFAAQPAYAGYWSLTGTPTGGYTPVSAGSGPSITTGPSYLSFTDFGIYSGSPLFGSFTYTGTIQWVPNNGNINTDPAPATASIAETSDSWGRVLYSEAGSSTGATDGLNDPPVTALVTGYPGNTLTTTSTGTQDNIVSVPTGGTYSFTRQFSTYASNQLNEGSVTYSVTVATAPLSINCGGGASGSFIADTDFSGGGTNTWTTAVDTSLLSGTIPPQTVLQSDREGNSTYTISGFAANSPHIVTLYFVEQYWNAPGKREFNVVANGTTELTNFDIYAAAGADYKAIQRGFEVNANTSGQIVLNFTTVIDNAKIGGIVIN